MSNEEGRRSSRGETSGCSFARQYREKLGKTCRAAQNSVILQSKIYYNMKNKLKEMTWEDWLNVALYALAGCLLVVGFLFPPPGEIHNSVLIGVGEIFAFAALLTTRFAIKRGRGAKITHGETTLEINEAEKNGNDEEE